MSKRRDNDYYPTPYPLVELGVKILMEEAGYIYMDHVLDPGCGPDARFAKELTGFAGNITACDINPVEPVAGVHVCSESDFLDWDLYGCFDLVVGNPPFSLATDFVERSHEVTTDEGVIVFLLPSAFTETVKRKPFWEKFKPTLKKKIELVERPSFYTDNGVGPTDGKAMAFYVWDKAHNGPTELEIRSWR